MLEQCQARRDALLGLLQFDLGSADVPGFGGIPANSCRMRLSTPVLILQFLNQLLIKLSEN